MSLRIDNVVKGNIIFHDHPGEDVKGGVVGGVTPVDSVAFDVLYTETGSEPQGSLFYNSTDGTLDIVLNGVNLHLGQQLYFYGKASGTITKGALVQFAGVQGSHILIKECVVAEIQANPTYLIGVASEDLSNNDFGYVTYFGFVNNVYTNTPDNGDNANWVAGDILYFSNTTGGLTKTLPTKPDTEIEVAVVVKIQTGASQTGRILVRPTIYHKLGELSDVDTTSIADGKTLVWDNANSKWVMGDHGSLSGLADDDHTQYVVLSPANSTRNVIQPTGDFIPLTLKGNATQTANIFEVQNSNGTVLSSIDSTGIATFGNLFASSRGVTIKEGTASDINTVISGDNWTMKNSRTTGGGWARNVMGFTNISDSVYYQIGAFGTQQDVTYGYLGTAYDNALLNWTTTSMTAGVDRVGVNLGNITPTATLDILGTEASGVHLKVKGATSQTANLFEVQNSSGTSLFEITSSGLLEAQAGSATLPSYSFKDDPNTGIFSSGSDTLNFSTGGGERLKVVGNNVFINTEGQDNRGLVIGRSDKIGSANSLEIFNGNPGIRQTCARVTGGFAFFYFDSHAYNSTTTLSTHIAQVGALGNVNSGATPPSLTYIYFSSIADPAYNNANMYLHDTGNVSIGINNTTDDSSLNIKTNSASSKGLIVKATASQTANLFEAQNSSATILSRIASNGNLYIQGTADPKIIVSENASTSSYLEIVDGGPGFCAFNKYIGSGGGSIDINILPSSPNVAAFRFFRSTNTSGVVSFQIFLGNNTTTFNHQIAGNDRTYLDTQNYGVAIGEYFTPSAEVHIKGGASAKTLIAQANVTGTSNIFEAQNSSGTVLASIGSGGKITTTSEIEIDGALNHDGTTVGFYGVTPVSRATTSIAESAFVANSGTTVNDNSTFDGYTLRQVVKALKDIGILT